MQITRFRHISHNVFFDLLFELVSLFIFFISYLKHNKAQTLNSFKTEGVLTDIIIRTMKQDS